MSAISRGGTLALAAALLAGCASVLTTGPAPQAGKTGLEIEGIDADGTALKLSDYRGKVVLLDFWSTT